MDRQKKISAIRAKLASGKVSVGGWMQLADTNVAEIMGKSGFDWVAVDMEHGCATRGDLPNLSRAIEVGGTIALGRVPSDGKEHLKWALDSGLGGVIIPNVTNAESLNDAIQNCRWPPAGRRGVGYCRGNLFGAEFDKYSREAQSPLVIAMVEDIQAVKSLTDIIAVEGLDAVFIGPYDLSASMGITGDFHSSKFVEAIDMIITTCARESMPCGMHIIEPRAEGLSEAVNKGFQFVAYSIDTVMFRSICYNPHAK